MIATLIALAVGVVAVFAGVGCLLAGAAQNKRNFTIAGITIPALTWLVIIVLRLSGALDGDWP